MVAEQTGAGRFLDAQSVYYFWKNVFNVTLHCCLMINLIWFWVLHVYCFWLNVIWLEANLTLHCLRKFVEHEVDDAEECVQCDTELLFYDQHDLVLGVACALCLAQCDMDMDANLTLHLGHINEFHCIFQIH